MKKKKKILIIAIIIVVLVAVVIAVCCVNMDNKESTDNTEYVTVSEDDELDDLELYDGEDSDEGDGSDSSGGSGSASSSDSGSLDDSDSSSDDKTDYWDNVEVYEDGDSGETMTDENGEYVTESYPGEADGWSPIVTPDDLD